MLSQEGLQLPRDAEEPTAPVILNIEALLALFSTERQVILASFQCFLATPFSGTSLSSLSAHEAHPFGGGDYIGW